MTSHRSQLRHLCNKFGARRAGATEASDGAGAPDAKGSGAPPRWPVPGALVALFALFAAAASAAVASPAAQAACPNEALRMGPSAMLPDCRAYELVSPADSEGRPLYTVETSVVYNQFPTELISPSLDSFLYMTRSLPLTSVSGANGILDVYKAERSHTGWITTKRMSPSGAQAASPAPGGWSSGHHYFFSAALPVRNGSAIDPSGSQSSEGIEGVGSYLGDETGHYEFVGIGSLGIDKLAQGLYITPDGTHMIFATGDIRVFGIGSQWCERTNTCPAPQLEPDAPPNGTPAIYERSADGDTHTVSLLPGNTPLAAGEGADYQGNSVDASVIAFRVGTKLYVRVNNSLTKEVVNGSFTFGGLTATGSKLFYLLGGNAFEFDVSSGATRQITTSGDTELVNISPDGSHVYFLSQALLDGAEGVAGEPNLYVWTGSVETTNYIATVSPADLEVIPGLNNWTGWAVSPERGRGPAAESSRVTPDGTVLAFESRAELTNYDPEGHNEIYRYDSDAENLQCVSCNPKGSPAAFEARLAPNGAEFAQGSAETVINNLSNDGSRLFFETSEGLVRADVDGINDIYEWHQNGATEELDLISLGSSASYPPLFAVPDVPKPNILLAIDPTGANVFFHSLDKLLPQAPGGGGSAIYDARINGGIPSPPSPVPCSESRPCKGSAAHLPQFGSPVSQRAAPSGNVKAHHRRCRRGYLVKKGKKKICRRHKKNQKSGKKAGSR